MRLKFDDLPVLLLEEVFECLNPIELFDIQYLNRYLYQVINKVINYNSIYSMYDNTIYGLYQERFIKENGKLIRHLNLSEKKLELINYCPNLTSIKFGEFIRSDYDGDYNCKITMKLPKLKKLILSTYVNSIKLLGLFSCCLDQIEFIEVNEFSKYDGEVKKVIKYFNADVVKKIELYYGGNLSLDGLDTIKAKFTKLKMLRLLANNNVFNSTKLDPAISFVSHLKLEIEGNLTVNFDINSLGNLQNLRSLKLLDNSGSQFNKNKKNSNNITFIESKNITVSGYLDFKVAMFYDMATLSGLRELRINNISSKLFNIIPLLPNIQQLDIKALEVNVKKTFRKLDSKGNNIYRSNYKHHLLNENSRLKCKFIKQIKINFSYLFLDDFICFISFFPNLERLKVVNFNLKGIKSAIEYKLSTPLLLIAPIPYVIDSTPYIALEKMPLLDWIKI